MLLFNCNQKLEGWNGPSESRSLCLVWMYCWKCVKRQAQFQNLMLPDTLTGAWHILHTVSLWQGQPKSHKYKISIKHNIKLKRSRKTQNQAQIGLTYPSTNKQKFSHLFDVFTIFWGARRMSVGGCIRSKVCS